MSPGNVAREGIPFELFRFTYPGRHVARERYPQRQVARDTPDLSLGNIANVVQEKERLAIATTTFDLFGLWSMAHPPPPPPQVTSFILAVQWPPGVCSGNSGVTCQIKPVPTEFTIHGLWPEPKGAESTEIFDANKLATLATELCKYWPNLKSTQQSISINATFWLEEWKKHGKYSGLGVREYFEKSLELHKHAGQGLRAKLAAAAEKIIPTIYNTYKLVDVQAAVNG
ncbi:extracellular ribonuclease LE [Tanacetum coccineum]